MDQQGQGIFDFLGRTGPPLQLIPRNSFLAYLVRASVYKPPFVASTLFRLWPCVARIQYLEPSFRVLGNSCEFLLQTPGGYGFFEP